MNNWFQDIVTEFQTQFQNMCCYAQQPEGQQHPVIGNGELNLQLLNQQLLRCNTLVEKSEHQKRLRERDRQEKESIVYNSPQIKSKKLKQGIQNTPNKSIKSNKPKMEAVVEELPILSRSIPEPGFEKRPNRNKRGDVLAMPSIGDCDLYKPMKPPTIVPQLIQSA